ASGVVGDAFTHTFTATGVPEATFTYDDELLPPGVTRTGDTLSGTPTEAGEFSISATASNGVDPDDTQELVITIDERSAITSDPSAEGAVGTPFSHTFTASGSPAPALTYTDVTLPDGGTLDGDPLCGTPTETGDLAVTATGA